MIVLISPAKSLNLEPKPDLEVSSPLFKKETAQLAAIMKGFTQSSLAKLMGLSDNLAHENVMRFQNFKSRNTKKNSKAAVFTFDGDVYRGLKANDWTEGDLEYAQGHLRILSGLYGILRPLDAIQPYRLEMGTTIKTEAGNSLYKFWQDKPTTHLNNALRAHSSKHIINLASNEYFKVIDKKVLKAPILDINFKEYRDGQVKFISFSAKVARGLMAGYIVKNRIEDVEDIKGFNEEGYAFDTDLSTEKSWIFSR